MNSISGFSTYAFPEHSKGLNLSEFNTFPDGNYDIFLIATQIKVIILQLWIGEPTLQIKTRLKLRFINVKYLQHAPFQQQLKCCFSNRHFTKQYFRGFFCEHCWFKTKIISTLFWPKFGPDRFSRFEVKGSVREK